MMIVDVNFEVSCVFATTEVRVDSYVSYFHYFTSINQDVLFATNSCCLYPVGLYVGWQCLVYVNSGKKHTFMFPMPDVYDLFHLKGRMSWITDSNHFFPICGKQSHSRQWLENAVQLKSIEILDWNFVILKKLAII